MRYCFPLRPTGHLPTWRSLNGGVLVSVPVTEEQKFNLPAMKEKIGEKTKNCGDLQSE